MVEEYRVVDVWVGRFPSESAFEAYLRESYEEEDEDAPLSPFAADMGVSFYDHDFVESSYHGEPSSDLEALLNGHSFARSYLPHALDAYRHLNGRAVNAVLLVWGEQIPSPRSVRTLDHELEYLGRFACETRI